VKPERPAPPGSPPPPLLVRPHRRRLRLRLVLPLAIALLAALAAPWLLATLRTPPPRVALLADLLPEPAGLVDHFWPAAADPVRDAAGRLDRRSTLAGILLLDARLALAAGRGERAAALLARLADLLGGIEPLEPEVARARALAAAVAAGADPAARTAEVDELESALAGRLLPGWFELGRWAEAGRLAAAARDPVYFAARATRVRLKRLRAPGAGLDAGTSAAFGELRAFCDSPPAAEPEWAALAARLDELLVRATP